MNIILSLRWSLPPEKSLLCWTPDIIIYSHSQTNWILSEEAGTDLRLGFCFSVCVRHRESVSQQRGFWNWPLTLGDQFPIGHPSLMLWKKIKNKHNQTYIYYLQSEQIRGIMKCSPQIVPGPKFLHVTAGLWEIFCSSLKLDPKEQQRDFIHCVVVCSAALLQSKQVFWIILNTLWLACWLGVVCSL